MMLNIVMLIYLAAGCVWSILCYPQAGVLGAETLLTGTVVVASAGFVIGAASQLMPDLPRLPRERVRLREEGGPFLGVALLLIAGALTVWAWEHSGAAAGVFSGVCCIAMFGCCLMVAAARRCISAGAEGLRIRTVFGRVYDLRWTDITGELAMKGSWRLYAGKRWFAIPGSTKAVQAFLRLCHERRTAAGVPVEKLMQHR